MGGGGGGQYDYVSLKYYLHIKYFCPKTSINRVNLVVQVALPIILRGGFGQCLLGILVITGIVCFGNW